MFQAFDNCNRAVSLHLSPTIALQICSASAEPETSFCVFAIASFRRPGEPSSHVAGTFYMSSEQGSKHLIVLHSLQTSSMHVRMQPPARCSELANQRTIGMPCHLHPKCDTLLHDLHFADQTTPQVLRTRAGTEQLGAGPSRIEHDAATSRAALAG